MSTEVPMREITIRTMTSDDHRRRNLVMTEIISDRGLVARAEKHYAYYVAEKKDDITSENPEAWIEHKAREMLNKHRHVTIRRIFDKDTGVGQTVFRTTGSFYILKEFKVYAVVFLHSVKFDILSSPDQFGIA